MGCGSSHRRAYSPSAKNSDCMQKNLKIDEDILVTESVFHKVKGSNFIQRIFKKSSLSLFLFFWRYFNTNFSNQNL